MRLKVAAEGNAGIRGGGPGDLLVTVGIRPHEHFRKDGIDIHHTLSVNMVQATIGGDFSIPTLDGTTRLKLPAGTQSGTTFRLHGKGLPKPDGRARGDQLVQVRVETPTRISRRQRQLLQEFEDSAEGTTPDVEPAQRDGAFPFSDALLVMKQWLGKFQNKGD
jgi:molecular chaperone DnaJ